MMNSKTSTRTTAARAAWATTSLSLLARLIVLAILAFGLQLLSSAPALAQSTGVAANPQGSAHADRAAGVAQGPMAQRLQRRMEKMFAELKVTDTQRAQIQQILRNAAPQAVKNAQRSAELHKTGRMLMAAPRLDNVAIERWQKEMLAHMDQAARARMATKLAIGQVLTPEQRAQWAARMDERESSRRDRARRHGAGGHPWGAQPDAPGR
jgi:Spy/CpxP family protein refolding chaperone